MLKARQVTLNFSRNGGAGKTVGKNFDKKKPSYSIKRKED
jgi:hypothetical protein